MASLLRRLGAEFTANSTTAGYQASPQISPLPGGGFVMAWNDESWDGSFGGITAQRFDADGARVGGEIHVNNVVSGTQAQPSVAALASGGFVVTWTGEGNGTSSDLKGRLFDSAGVPVGPEFAVNTPDTIDQMNSQAIALSGGGFVVHWLDTGAPFGGNDPNVRAQIFDSTGAKVGSDFTVNATLAGTQREASGVALTGGGFVIVWVDYPDSGIGDVKGQVFDSSGNRVGGEFMAPSNTAGMQWGPDVAALPGGGFVVAWQGTDNSASAQIFDAAGAKVGSEILASNSDNSVGPIDVTGLPGDAFLVVWNNTPSSGPYAPTMKGQLFDPAGNRLGSQFQLNQGGIDGVASLDLATLASGRVVASWSTSGSEIQAAVFRAPLIGTPAADVLAGTGVDDGIAGLASDDELSGGGGNDVLDGGLGADLMTGGADDDIYVVDDAGDETIELAGQGIDGVETSLADYALQAHVENLTGTSTGSEQTLRGNALDNVLTGGAAGATFHLGSGGHDVVLGGDWDDLLVIDWEDSVSDVITSPALLFTFPGASGGYRDGEARSVAFSGLEQVDITTGSGDDVVYLPGGGSSARTGAGDDKVYLGSLLDTADGGSGVDGIEAVFQDAENPIVWDLSAAFQGISGFEYFLYLLAGIDGDVITTTAAAASDHIDGWKGADEITLYNGHDIVSGGFVIDYASDLLRVDWSAYDDHVQVTLHSGSFNGASGWILGGPDRSVQLETFERFVILTGGGGDSLMGWTGSDVLNSGAGDDWLDGRGGADMMTGGTGDDIYFVDHAGDSAIEFAGEGTDEIRTGLATYSLAGLPDIENLTATSAVAHDFRGNGGNNVVIGGGGNDVLRLYDGGNDNVAAGGGNDNIFFIGALTSADVVNGGAGVDTLVLQGPYAALTLTVNISQIENISILAGSNTAFGEPGTNRYDYALTTNDSNFAAGVQARINGAALMEGEDFTFNGSAETDAKFVVYGGKGKDILTGGLGNDIFFFAEDRFATGDTVDGGAGYDGMFLRGNYTINFGAPGYTGLFTGIENLTLTSATDERYARGGGTEFDYNLILNGAMVGAGQVLTVSGALLTASETMEFDAGAVTEGTLRLFGGAAADILWGGALADLLHGGLGADRLSGNVGADVFRYQDVAESNSASMDQLLDFFVGTDKIDLTRIDANTHVAGDQAFAWIGTAAFTGSGAASAGQLRAYSSSGNWFVEGDIDGNGIADLVIQVDGPTPLSALDFML